MSLTVSDVQALRVGWDGTNSRLNIGATATGKTTSSRIAALSSDVGYHLNISGAAAATTDFYVPGGIILFGLIDANRINCISATGGNGTLYISESV